MPFRTSGRVEIAAPPAQVFSWLVEREKLRTWVGGNVDQYPADASELRVGYRSKSTFPAPDGPRDSELEITAYDPPREVGMTQTYAGGHNVASYRLSESGGGTVLELESTTDPAAAPTSVPDEVEKQIEAMPDAQEAMARAGMEQAMRMMQTMKIDENPMVAKAMQDKVDSDLARLKQLVEGG